MCLDISKLTFKQNPAYLIYSTGIEFSLAERKECEMKRPE